MHLFENEPKLPALPIPELSDTCQHLKQMIKPLVDETTWQEACTAIDRFSQEGGSGQQLHQLLLQWKAEKPGNSNWIQPFWLDGYLSFRETLPINKNYFFQLGKDIWSQDGLPLMITGICHVINKIRTGDLQPEVIRGEAQSMDTLKNLFYTRIPNTNRDTQLYVSSYAPFAVSVVCKGHWFILTVTDEAGEIFSLDTIDAALLSIRQQAEQLGPASSIGALTCANRDKAVQLRTALCNNLLNRTSLDSLERSLFTICLDENVKPNTYFGKKLMADDPLNRWYDKSLQIISTQDKLGVNFEHTGCDANIWIYLLTQVMRAKTELISSLSQTKDPAHIRRLEWDIPEDLHQQFEEVRAEFTALSSKVLLSQRKVTSVTQNMIKERNFSPDAFVQLLYQSAYYQLTQRFRSVYESVSARCFYQGRTECIRSCTEESVAFLRALTENTSSKEELLDKMRAAETAHRKQIGICHQALGPERYMTGLNAMYQMYKQTPKGADIPKPDLFDNLGYQTLTHDALSTSCAIAPCIEFFGFGPVVSDGIGIGYGLSKESLQLMVTAYLESGIDPEKFIDTVEESAQKLFAILD